MQPRPSRIITTTATLGATAFAARAISSLATDFDFAVPGDGWRSLLQLAMAGALVAGVARARTASVLLPRAFAGIGAIHLAMAAWERFDGTRVFGLLKVTERDHWAHPLIGVFCLAMAALSRRAAGRSSADGTRRTVIVSRRIAASAASVFALVADPPAHRHSPETIECIWLDDRRGRGARFRGTNRIVDREWSTECVVTAHEPDRIFAYEVVRPARVSRWTYTVEPDGDASTVTEQWDDLRSPLVTVISRHRSGIADRASHNERTMTATLEHLSAAAEAATLGR